MVKKRSRKNRKFNKRFNIWDILLIILVVGIGAYLLTKDGVRSIIENLASIVFYGLIGGLIFRFISRRTSR